MKRAHFRPKVVPTDGDGIVSGRRAIDRADGGDDRRNTQRASIGRLATTFTTTAKTSIAGSQSVARVVRRRQARQTRRAEMIGVADVTSRTGMTRIAHTTTLLATHALSRTTHIRLTICANRIAIVIGTTDMAVGTRIS